MCKSRKVLIEHLLNYGMDILPTPFELWYGYPPNVKYFKIFGSKCYILKDDGSGKFDAKSDEGIFLGYSTISKAYKCLNTNTKKLWKVQM